jgi:hypothetical protein
VAEGTGGGDGEGLECSHMRLICLGHEASARGVVCYRSCGG